MSENAVSPATLAALLKMQQNECDEAEIYRRIALKCRESENREVLLRLSSEEGRHEAVWEKYTGKSVAPRRGKVLWHTLLAKLFGFTFAVKLMEKGEAHAQVEYERLIQEVPEAKDIEEQENAHESALLSLLDEERLKYVGSMVLGLNDALVELSGTLAGLTLAMQNTRLIALSGLITGISATLSMASSEFLSAKSEGRQDALKSCLYTGVAYLITVALLILPYLLFPPANYLFALGTMLLTVLLILVVFNYYISVAKDMPFRRRFGEMAAISLGVALLSFLIGIVVKNFLGIDV